MIPVAHHDAGFQTHAMHDFSDSRDALCSAGSLGLNQNRLGGDTALAQVGTADFTLGEHGIAAASAGGKNAWRHVLKVQEQSVVEPRLQHWRGPSTVLRRAEHYDDVGWVGFIHRRLLLN